MILSASNAREIKELELELKDMQSRLSKPLCVAVVGLMKAGKSTFMNALMKEKILSTGTLETTYTVSWFKYGESPSLKIVFKDGSEKIALYEELEKWTVRPLNTEKHILDEVAHVEIYYPNEILKTMELIDTPGLESTYKTDSLNTLNFLGQRLAKEADKITSETASQAEAIVYAFSRAVAGKDAEVLEAFKGEENHSSPLNAIGIFTKVDGYWNLATAPDSDPLEIVRDACHGYKEKLKEKLYTVLPVVAKPVETICNMNDYTYQILEELSRVDQTVLLEFLVDSYFFANEPADEDMPVSAKQREYILNLFGQYGIYSITKALRNGLSREELPDYLYKINGIESASKIVRSHFGNRAYLIKLDYVLRRLRSKANKILHNNNDFQVSQICQRIIEDIDALCQDEQAFSEIEALQMYYSGDLKIPEAYLEDFLQITGEYGSHCEARLGFHSPTEIKVMKKEAHDRARKWNGIANDFNNSKNLTEAAKIIVRSYENLYYYLDMLGGYEE